MSHAGQKDWGDVSMLDLFRMEVEGQSALLNEGLLALEKDPGAKGPLESLMRAAHSIKGAARIVQLDGAVRLAHAMEDCFVAAQQGRAKFGPEAVDELLRGVDVLTQIGHLGAQEAPAWFAGHAGEIDGLVERISAIAAGPEASAAAGTVRSAGEGARAPLAGPEAPAGAVLADASMLDLFRQEVEERAAALSEGLLALEKKAASEAGLEELMRAAHSIKGAARVIQLDSAVRVAHAMEECFVSAQRGEVKLGGEEVDVLLQGVDLLARIGRLPPESLGSWPAEHAAEIERVASACSSIAAGRRPAASEAPQPAAEPAAAPAPAEAGAKETAESRDRFVRVTAENLDRLMGLAGECLVEVGWLRHFADSLMRVKGAEGKVITLLDGLRAALAAGDRSERPQAQTVDARERAGQGQKLLLECANDFEMFSRRLENLTDRLHGEVVATCMRPLADGVQGFPRVVRDLARKLGKQVKLEIVGKSTPVDRDVLDKLESPLNHLLRNAVDHGIEAPEERRAAGKPPEGTVRLEAAHRAGMLSIVVSDDGGGIDVDRLRRKLVERKLVMPEVILRLTEGELLDFLFLPGFSTAQKVTEISGRGVGLDVVQSMVHEIGGVVHVTTQRGRGTRFHLQLPITLSVLRTLLVEIAGEPYAFALARIDCVLVVPRERIATLEDRQYFAMGQENIGLVSARQVLGCAGEREAPGDALSVIVVSDRLSRYGLVVDRFLGEQELVVRPLDPRLGKVKDIGAAALTEKGVPLLIVDVEDMVRSIDSLLSGGRVEKLDVTAEKAQAKRRKRLLVVDDSITVREVERKMLENRGYEVDVAVDGIDGWNAVRSGQYDLVISDVDMPRMNGIDLATRIKQDPKLKSIPVMIVSYKDRQEDRLRGLEAGANYYLTKSSFHDETLLNAVRDLIGEGSS